MLSEETLKQRNIMVLDICRKSSILMAILTIRYLKKLKRVKDKRKLGRLIRKQRRIIKRLNGG